MTSLLKCISSNSPTSSRSTPTSSRNRAATAAPRSGPYTDVAGALCTIARWKSPSALGEVIRVVTDAPPEDSPKTVISSGSPPKAEMHSRTQCSAAIWSRKPRLVSKTCSSVEKDDRSRKPNAPRRKLIETTTTSPFSLRCRPSYTCCADEPSEYAPPWIHTSTGRSSPSGRGAHTLSDRQSSEIDNDGSIGTGLSRPCGAIAPKCRPSSTPFHGCRGRGARNRKSPTGGVAYGIPLQATVGDASAATG